MALVATTGDAFMKDNLAFDIKGMGLPLTYGNINILSEKPVWPIGFEPLTADEVVGYITRSAGARPKERDGVDQRMIQDFLDRKGQILDSQDEVGGYPKYKATYRKLDVPQENIDNWLINLASKLQ